MMGTINNIWIGRTAYQIVVDRFNRSGKKLEHINGRKLKEWHDRMPDWKPDCDGEYRNLFFYGGDLKGIEQKLSYIKRLGFEMIYLTPIEQSSSYHHYDVGNHLLIDPWIGTWDDFQSLCKKAKEQDILIVVDLVFNHTGINSIYFDNPEYQGWYTGSYWAGFKDMPECNTLSKDYQKAMTQVIEKYLENGASGIRLDLGENLSKEFLQAIAEVKKAYPNTIFIGEMWAIATDKEDPKILDGQLDSVMNYPMGDAILRWTRYGKNQHFAYNFYRVNGEYPKNIKNVLLNNIATHDTPTAISMLVGDMMNPDVFNGRIWDIEGPWRYYGGFDTYKFREYEAEHDKPSESLYIQGKKMLKIALAIMYTIPGIPCVYQGTEIADSGYKDPFNRKPYNWNNQEEEMKDFVQKLGKYRKENSDILGTGDAYLLKNTESVLILERRAKTGRLILAVNRTSQVQDISLQSYVHSPRIVFNHTYNSMIRLNPYGIIIVRKD